MLSKQDKERLTAAEREYWNDERMVKHCVNCATFLFDLRGKIVIIEKTGIKTDFCFGYGVFGGDYDSALDMAAHARKNEHYFIRENHRSAPYAETIAALNDSRWIAYASPKYIGDSKQMLNINFMRDYEFCEKEKRLPENSFLLTDEEIKAYKLILAKAAQEHHKKIKAYLKRYGLTKVNSWTYWADE